MSSRNRHSAVQPIPSQQSSQTQACNTLPPYRKPSHPLNQRAKDSIRNLSSSRTHVTLKDHHTRAQTLISEAAASINDHLYEREEHVARRRKKWEKGQKLEEQEDMEKKLEELQAEVERVTGKLEERLRDSIDGLEAVARVEESLGWVRDNAGGLVEQEYNTQIAQSQAQSQSQSQQRRGRDADGDEDMEAEDEDENEQPTPGPTPLSQNRPALTGPSLLFKDRVQRKKEEYTSFSHTARYSKNNAYISFRGLIHDARHGESAPPLPHPDTWFTERGSPAPGITGRITAGGDADGDEDDIVVDRSTISTRCPITFLPLKDPYTSKKCPHTFEKQAILDMIRRSTIKVASDSGGPQEKAAQCPVTGCDMMLRASDLWRDVVVVRKVRRMREVERREREGSGEEDGDGDAGGGSGSGEDD